MKVILKQDISGVGRKYEVKNVADGYAINFLLPRKLAEHATPESIKKVESQKAEMEAEIKIKEELTKKQIEMLSGVKVMIEKKSNDKGHLFEKIHIEEIIEALKNQSKIELDPKFINLEDQIKEIGEHKINVSTGGKKGEFVLVVKSL